MKTNFKKLQKSELIRFMEKCSQKPYRAGQLIHWIYKRHVHSFEEMTDLSKEFRKLLDNIAFISNIHLLQRQVSKDGTEKFLFELEDGETIESVLIPNNKDRFTLCISSQAGCAVGCRFCTTGRLGLKRNLKDYEIVDQVISVSRIIEQRQGIRDPESIMPQNKNASNVHYGISNIVFMGMGEPLHNLNDVIKALWKITDFMGFSKRKITVSTAGIVPGIQELARRAPNVNLAVSLNATTDKIRDIIMPINRKYPIENLLNACREFPLSPNRRITFEYVLLDGINDSKEDAHRLVKLLTGVKSKVNLIPYNPGKEPPSSASFTQAYTEHKNNDMHIELRKPAEKNVQAFQEILQKAGIATIIRKSMGSDISAACGQLKAAY